MGKFNNYLNMMFNLFAGVSPRASTPSAHQAERARVHGSTRATVVTS
jgi:hypothetical protein